MVEITDKEVREDFDKLRILLVRVAQHLLEQQGEFYPFAGLVSPQGQAQLVAADIGKEKPAASEMIEFLTGALHAKAMSGECRATAIGTDVLVRSPGSTSKTDALQLSLEHRKGIYLNVIIPYVKIAPGTYRMGSAQPAESKAIKSIFSENPQSH